ncbi:MAG TPA: hypothetical protein VHB02_18590 [Acidimicrobiales bacterium]|nr:hypothetical protein [Acidimicrobiales bacterium]
MTNFLASNWIWILLVVGFLYLSFGRRRGGMGRGMGGGCGGGGQASRQDPSDDRQDPSDDHQPEPGVDEHEPATTRRHRGC